MLLFFVSCGENVEIMIQLNLFQTDEGLVNEVIDEQILWNRIGMKIYLEAVQVVCRCRRLIFQTRSPVAPLTSLFCSAPIARAQFSKCFKYPHAINFKLT